MIHLLTCSFLSRLAATLFLFFLSPRLIPRTATEVKRLEWCSSLLANKDAFSYDIKFYNKFFFLPLIWKSKHSTPSWKNNYRLYGSKWWNKLSARWKKRWPGSPKKVEDVIVIRPCRSSQCFNEVETWTIWWKRNSPSGRNSSLIAFSHSTGSLVFKPPDPSLF